jgi:ketosteroid isomerase-like protein
LSEPTEHPNATLIRAFYDRLAARDIDGVLSLLADDVVFRIDGDHILSGEHRGKAGVASLGQRVLEETDGTLASEPLAILANDSHAVVLHHLTGERRDRRIDVKNFIVFRITDGLIVERTEVLEDPAADDEFWAR